VSCRKWLVRGLVFAAVAGLAVVGLYYQRWTNPAALRRQVIAKFGEHFPGATIVLESARLRLFGGIALSEVRLARRDDAGANELAYFPSAVLHPDKEKMMDGRFALRKVELNQPRLRVLRNPDGRWNVAGILGIPQPEVPIPLIVVHQGTILLEDRLACPGQAPLEIKNINLTLVNDPLTTLTFEGTATSALAGTVRVSGSWQRRTDETTVCVESNAVPLGAALLGRLQAYCSQLRDGGLQLEGSAGFLGKFDYHPGPAPHWTHDCHFQLAGAKINHPRLPFPLDQVEAAVRCFDGQLALEKFSARSGTARVTAQGWAQALGADADLEGKVAVEDLQVTADVLDRVPALKKVEDDFQPAGPAKLALQVSRTRGQWVKQYEIYPTGMTALCKKFPYRLDRISGAVRETIDTERQEDVLRLDLVGFSGPQRVYVKGRVTGEGPTSGVDVTVWGTDLPLDAKLKAALQPQHQELADTFRPTGLADIEAHLYRPLGSTEFENRYLVRFHDATVRYQQFPYPLENVSGVLDIRPDHWEFRDFRGTHKGGEVRTRGRSHPQPGGENRLAIEVSGQKLLLDGELEGALATNPELRSAWGLFAPTGRMNFLARVDCPADQPPDVDVTVTPLGCSVQPKFFPYLLERLNGTVHYAKGWVYLDQLEAHHGATTLTFDRAEVCLKPGGGVYAEVVNLRGAPLVPDRDLLQALPGPLRAGCLALSLKDPVGLHTRLVIDSGPEAEAAPVVYWDGEVTLAKATLTTGVPLEQVSGQVACRGRYNGRQLEDVLGYLALDEVTVLKQPFRGVRGQMEVSKNAPEVLMFPGLQAHIFGGEVYGPARVEFGPELRYQLNLTASQIQLEEFGQHNLSPEAEVSGLATASLYLEGRGADLAGLQGRGAVDVPKGRLFSLPLLLDLLKPLGLHLPDRTAFEEAHAKFAVNGPRVTVSRFDLFGNSISLRGQGEMNLDGSDINLDFYAVWARVIQMLPPVIKDIPQGISKHLLKIKMRGRIGNVEVHKEPVPVLVEPLKDLLQMMGGRGRAAAKEGAEN
jgi:hypothetical protein